MFSPRLLRRIFVGNWKRVGKEFFPVSFEFFCFTLFLFSFLLVWRIEMRSFWINTPHWTELLRDLAIEILLPQIKVKTARNYICRANGCGCSERSSLYRYISDCRVRKSNLSTRFLCFSGAGFNEYFVILLHCKYIISTENFQKIINKLFANCK